MSESVPSCAQLINPALCRMMMMMMINVAWWASWSSRWQCSNMATKSQWSEWKRSSGCLCALELSSCFSSSSWPYATTIIGFEETPTKTLSQRWSWTHLLKLQMGWWWCQAPQAQQAQVARSSYWWWAHHPCLKSVLCSSSPFPKSCRYIHINKVLNFSRFFSFEDRI